MPSISTAHAGGLLYLMALRLMFLFDLLARHVIFVRPSNIDLLSRSLLPASIDIRPGTLAIQILEDMDIFEWCFCCYYRLSLMRLPWRALRRHV